MENILKVSNLTKHYHDFSLARVGFELPGGSIMGLIGENGAGKTTTLKLILGLISADEGEVSLFDKRQTGDDREVKEQLGVVLDGSFFSDYLNAAEIGSALRHFYKSFSPQQYRAWLERFSLPTGKPVKDFSRGMRMKLALSSALAHSPRLLILDEATSGLDPVVRSEVLDVFLDFIQDEEHSILFSSHITGDLEQVADYITFLHRGQVVFSSAKDLLLERYGVLRCGEADFAALDHSALLGSRKNRFGYEALVADRSGFQQRYKNLVVDPAGLDDIMLFHIRGEH